MFSTFRQNLSHTPGTHVAHPRLRGQGLAPRAPSPVLTLLSTPACCCHHLQDAALNTAAVGWGAKQRPPGRDRVLGPGCFSFQDSWQKELLWGEARSDPRKTTGHPRRGARPPCLLLRLQPAVPQVRPQEPRGEARPQVSEVGRQGGPGAAELPHSASHPAAPGPAPGAPRGALGLRSCPSIPLLFLPGCSLPAGPQPPPVPWEGGTQFPVRMCAHVLLQGSFLWLCTELQRAVTSSRTVKTTPHLLVPKTLLKSDELL